MTMNTAKSYVQCIALTLFVIVAQDVMATGSNGGRDMSLKDMLMRDFSVNLNISGGFGQSKEDPIILLDSDQKKALLSEMVLLRCIGKGRGILWKTLTRVPLNNNNRYLEQVKIETKEVTQTEIITKKENYYFDVSAAATNSARSREAIVYRDEKSQLEMPYEIGWLHNDSVIDNEAQARGLGKTLSYGAPGIKATIYIYDLMKKNIPAGINSKIVKEEFESAISDYKVISHNEKNADGIFKSDAFLLKTNEQKDELSIIGMTSRGGRFIKLRITLDRDPILVDIVQQSITAFQNVISKQP